MRMRFLCQAPLELVVTVAAAQEPPPLPELRPGAPVRLEATTVLGRLEGRFERYTPDSLIVHVLGGARMAVPASTLTALWVRGHATKTGAIVGGAVGAAVVGFLNGALCSLGRSDDGIVGNEGFDTGCAAAGAGVGMVAGGGVGAGIGALIPRWRLRFRAPR
jgi:hypothetical protein